MRRFLVLGPVVALLVSPAVGCLRAAAWRGDPTTAPGDRAAHAEGEQAVDLDVPPPSSLRPCCAFGDEHHVEIGSVPVPGVELENVVSVPDLGQHQYDNGASPWGSDDERPVYASEQNGLLYTCRGGFIDTAHVRDYADWTVFVAAQVGPRLASGGELALPDEGGRRLVRVGAVPGDAVARIGGRRLLTALAQWTAFQLSVWHEIATWYGWSSSSVFPETASAFSPEDLYSNLLGVTIAGQILRAEHAGSEADYNESVDVWLRSTLEWLGVVSPETTRAILDALDGRWWDSTRRLPEKELVVRRNVDLAMPLAPWRLPARVGPEPLRLELARRCSSGARVERLALPGTLGGLRIADVVTLVVRPEDAVAERLPVARPGGEITQADFPAIAEAIRAEIVAEFGPGATTP